MTHDHELELTRHLEDAPGERRVRVLRAVRAWRAGEDAGLPDELARALADADPSVRRTGAEGCGFAPDAGRRSVGKLVGMLAGDPVEHCREAAAFALGEIGGRAGLDALLAAAGRDGSPLVREAVVAALGAVGDETAVPVVVGMTRGEKPAVRRRAVIACAAFDDVTADAAIRAALGDRDRYVREAASWILRPPS